MHRKILSLIFLITCTQAMGQLPKMDTDRPDQTECPFIVPTGWIQEEIGFIREQLPLPYGTGRLYGITMPTILSKYGLSKKWELRLITEYYRETLNGRLKHDTIGLLPVQLGFKVNLVAEKGWIPRISLIFHSSLNRLSGIYAQTHSGSFVGFNSRLTFQNTLSEHVGLGYNLGVEWDDLNERPAFIYTLSPGVDLGERWYAYIEAFGEFTRGQHAQNALDGGIAYFINPNFKVDASGGFGIFNSELRYYFAIGGSFRFQVKK